MNKAGGTMNNDGCVLISGAGIGGLALAYWLRHHGFTPTVVDRATGLRSGGQAVDIRGKARDVVDRMGILPQIRSHHTGTRGIVLLDDQGQRLTEMDNEVFGDSGGIVADLEILRDDLVRLLHHAAGGDVDYRFDDTVTAMSQTDHGVTVEFDRSRTEAFDVVVGADGIHSNVRNLGFGSGSRFVRDLGYDVAFYRARAPMDLKGWELMYNLPAANGVGGRAAVLYPVGEDGDLRVMLIVVAPPSDLHRRELADQKDVLQQAFAGAGELLPGLLEQLTETDDLYVSRPGAVQVDRWSRGRTVLLGDSAFGGSIGMGTSMALVGAYVLAGELATAAGDHHRAFDAYEDTMRAYVRAGQQRPPGGARMMAPRSRAGIWLRAQSMRLMTTVPGGHKLMGDLAGTANRVEIKSYPRHRAEKPESSR